MNKKDIRLEDIDPQFAKSKYKRFSTLNESEENSKWRIFLKTIKTYGVLQPIHVGKKNAEGKYPLIDGRQRYEAAKVLKFETIPAFVDDSNISPQKESRLISTYQNARRNMTIAEQQEVIRETYEPMIRAQKNKEKIVSNLAEFIAENESLPVGTVKVMIQNIKQQLLEEDFKEGRKELTPAIENRVLGLYKEYKKSKALSEKYRSEMQKLETEIKKIVPLSIAKKIDSENSKSRKD